jgi:hypothetical protein
MGKPDFPKKDITKATGISLIVISTFLATVSYYEIIDSQTLYYTLGNFLFVIMVYSYPVGLFLCGLSLLRVNKKLSSAGLFTIGIGPVTISVGSLLYTGIETFFWVLFSAILLVWGIVLWALAYQEYKKDRWIELGSGKIVSELEE